MSVLIFDIKDLREVGEPKQDQGGGWADVKESFRIAQKRATLKTFPNKSTIKIASFQSGSLN